MGFLGKIMVVLGAGAVGSAVTNEADSSSSGLKDIFSGTLKNVAKHLKQDDKSQSASDSKITSAQIDALRQELMRLKRSESVTIVTSSTGSHSYGVTVVFVAGFIGAYGFIWWKGWKLSDMMFVTRRGFSDACSTVGKQLDVVSSAISHAKQHLSSRIDHVDSNLDECVALTATTKEEVSKIHGDLGGFHVDVRSVKLAVQNLESKLSEIEYGQDFANRGILYLAQFAQNLQESRNVELIQDSLGSSHRAIDLPQTVPDARTVSLPPMTLEPSSPSTSAITPTVLRSSTSVSSSGLKELQEISGPVRAAILRGRSMKAGHSEASNPAPATAGESTSSGSGRFGWKLPSISLLSRGNNTSNS